MIPFLIVLASVLIYSFGFFMGLIFASSRKERVDPCESINDIIEREG